MVCSSSASDTSLMALLPLLLSFLMDDVLSLFSSLASHPLQLAYLLFFSHSILRALSFLSPLLLTTSLLVLAALTVFPAFHHDRRFLGSALPALLDALIPGPAAAAAAPGLGLLESILEDLEDCVGMVEMAYAAAGEEDRVVHVDQERTAAGTRVDATEPAAKVEEGEEEGVPKQVFPAAGVIGWEEFEAIGKLYKALTDEMGEYPIKLAIRNLQKKKHHQLLERSDSKEGGGAPQCAEEEEKKNKKVIKPPCDSNQLEEDLGRCGSGRREKEWRRTLACKLYEERWVTGDGGGDEEGMDMLWEEHEDKNKNKDRRKAATAAAVAEDSNGKSKEDEKQKLRKGGSRAERRKEKQGVERQVEEVYEDDGEEEEEDDDDVRPICCLQALKFSTGRMRFGMGKMGGLVKATKALKGGVGLFRRSGSRSRRCREDLAG